MHKLIALFITINKTIIIIMFKVLSFQQTLSIDLRVRKDDFYKMLQSKSTINDLSYLIWS